MKNKVVKNASIILACSIIAKALSYVWEAILATYFGATNQADAFYMTTSIFNIIYPILDIGIWKVFLPIYKTKLVQKKEDDASRVANIAITLFFLFSCGLIIILLVLSKPLVAAFAPGFSDEKKAVTIEYMRLCTPYLLFAAASSLIGAMLQSHERFLGSQIREIGTHVARLVCIVICFQSFGIYAAILAMIVGSIFRLLVQIPFINWKWKFKPDFHFLNEDIIPMLKGLPSVAVTAAISHLNGLIDKMVASGAASGSVACMNYGHKLMSVFNGMVSTAIGTAVYPSIIQYITEKTNNRLKELLTNLINVFGFVIIPITCFCMLFSEQLVTIAFQRGTFDASATSITAGVFSGYCLGLLFMGVSTSVTNVFYGYGDTRITMVISLIGITVNIVLDLFFIRFWGVTGLAFATSVAEGISLCIRFVCLRKYIRLRYKPILMEYAKIVLMSLLSCGTPYLLFSWFPKTNVYVSLLICGILCGGMYFGLAALLRVKALKLAISLAGRRLDRKK